MTKKRIFIFCLTAAVFLLIAELLANICYEPLLTGNKIDFKNIKFLPYEKINPFNPESEFNFDKDKTFDGKNNKGAISVVGCSCTYGLGLKREETFAAKLNKLTERKVYSRVIFEKNLAYVYYQILHELIPKDTEYIIYFYLPHHIDNIFADEIPLRYE